MKIPGWMKIIFFIIILSYMIVNESERIELSINVENFKKQNKVNKKLIEKMLEDHKQVFQNWKIEEFIKNKERFENHTHRYYDGKINQ